MRHEDVTRMSRYDALRKNFTEKMLKILYNDREERTRRKGRAGKHLSRPA